ncbi:RNA polymerase sigma factor [Cystobacter ferrugineus]|uniref:RNA polymerase subunit sigma-24 n=1 Tax=Cystobacter ferrugineus TaxID=83449 RepID=A0A1L9BJX5_9BACT|nr:RNA polymerase sigma factor [Cystobacter ferrugineus]OJH42506.1 hypothetical protein BON30_04750 [Cystobacter ferrugineus]
MSDKHHRETQSEAAKRFVVHWKQHHRELFLLCLKLMGGNRADAEDALSQAAQSALRKFPSSEELENPKAWLVRVVRNASIDLLRMRKREWNSRVLIQGEPELSELEQQEEPGSNPEERYLQREGMRQLYLSLQDLPPHLRKPLLDRSVRGLSYAQIAQQSELTEVNLRKRVQEARRLLKENLDGHLARGTPMDVRPPRQEPRASGARQPEEPPRGKQAKCISSCP